MSLSRIHLALLLLPCVIWGGNFLVAAWALQHYPPFLFTALRLALVLLILWPWLRAPAQGHWPRLLAVAICNGALHFGINFYALRMAGDISSVAIAMQSYVPMTVLMSVWWLGERIGWKRSLAIGVSFLGVLLVGFDPLVLQHLDALALTLISAVFLAVGTVLMRGLRGVGTFALQGWTAVLGIPVLLLLSGLFESGQMQAISEASAWHWGAVAYSGLLASILGHGVLFYLIQRYPVSLITPYLLLAPVCAVAFGILLWGDRPGLQLTLGALLVFSGVLVIAVRSRPAPIPEPRALP